MNASQYRLSVVIFAEQLQFEAISSTLGLEPAHTHRRGDVNRWTRPDGSFGKASRPYPADLWRSEYFETTDFDKLEEHMIHICRRLIAFLQTDRPPGVTSAISIHALAEAESGVCEVSFSNAALALVVEAGAELSVTMDMFR